MVAEEVEIAELQAHLLRPEVEIIAVEGGNIGHGEREHGGRDEHVAAAGMAPQGLAGGIEHIAGEVGKIGVMG